MGGCQCVVFCCRNSCSRHVLSEPYWPGRWRGRIGSFAWHPYLPDLLCSVHVSISTCQTFVRARIYGSELVIVSSVCGVRSSALTLILPDTNTSAVNLLQPKSGPQSWKESAQRYRMCVKLFVTVFYLRLGAYMYWVFNHKQTIFSLSKV